jgi:hypothetical protein
MTALRTIEVWADTRGRGRCRACGARIEWAEIVKSAKKMPFDADLVALRTRHHAQTHRLIEEVDLATNHWATCPRAADFRR